MPVWMKTIIKEVTPPMLLRAARRIARRSGNEGRATREHGEKSPEWYDAAFDTNAHWKAHYTEVDYYFLWTVIVDRMIRASTRSVVDVGCGAGQLACLMRDKGIGAYYGLDFSEKRVAQARKVCPEYQFAVEDVFETDILGRVEYDAVICTEVLEHITRDIDVLQMIRAGTRFYGTVPNFPYMSHVRHFSSESEVTERYKAYFTDLRVDAFLANPNGKTFFLMEGVVA